MKHALFAAALASMFAFAAAAQAAGDPEAGKVKANGCAGCHGAKGEGKQPYPALAGKPQDDLVQALNDYKAGKRKNAIMNKLASKLTEREITDIAAYYASLK